MKIELKDRTERRVRIYFEKTRDPEIQAMLPQAARTVEQAVADYRKTLLPGATSFGRTIWADGLYVGDVWFYCIDPGETPNAMVSYCLFEKELWGRGIMTEALGLFVEEVLCRFPVSSLGAFAYQANGASLRVLEKNGFLFQETFEEAGVTSVYYQWEAVT